MIFTNDRNSGYIFEFVTVDEYDTDLLRRVDRTTQEILNFEIPDEPDAMLYILAAVSDEDGRVRIFRQEYEGIADRFYRGDLMGALHRLADKGLIEESADFLRSNGSEVEVILTERGMAGRRQVHWDAGPSLLPTF